MHPRVWARARCCSGRSCDVPSHPHHHFSPGEEGGGFGVRRPLRFLAWRLELDERQVGELARILNELKTERAQAAVDDRRASTLLADAVAGGTFDAARADEARALRVNSAGRVQEVVARSLGRIHAALEPEQRERLAYLIRTGTLML
jgi:Spy/CpxP family protein refolding chaperone